QRAFDVVFAAEADLVLPVGIAAEPVDAAGIEGDLLASLVPDLLAVTILGDLGGECGRVLLFGERVGAGEHEDVADAPFDDLGLDRGHPAVAVAAVRPPA